MKRVFSYARFSTELQSKKSNADQLRENRAYAARQTDWTIAREFQDAATSGTTLMRPGFQSLLQAARTGHCDVVLVENLDRLSRSQEDIAAFYERMKFAGVKIVTI